MLKTALTFIAICILMHTQSNAAAAGDEKAFAIDSEESMLLGRFKCKENHPEALNCIAHSYAKGSNILELGSGIGYHTHKLIQLGYSVTAVDLATEGKAVKWGELQGLYDGATLFKTKVQSLPTELNETFDAVFSYLFLIDYVEYKDVFTRLHQLTTPGGAVYLWIVTNEAHEVVIPQRDLIESTGFIMSSVKSKTIHGLSLMRLVKKSSSDLLEDILKGFAVEPPAALL